MKTKLLLLIPLLALGLGCGSPGGGTGPAASALRPVQVKGVWVHPETELPYSGDFDNTVGGIRMQMQIKDGRPHGRMQRWYASSQQLHQSLNYVNGQPDGVQTSWYPNGQKMMQAEFRRGQLRQGKSWHPDGSEASSVADGNGTWIKFDSIGRKLRETIYQNGLPVKKTGQAAPPVLKNGVWVHRKKMTPYTGDLDLVKNGSRLKMALKDGRPHGRMQSWYAAGDEPCEDFYYVNGQRDGLQMSWYPNGRKMMEAEFHLGQLLNSLTWRLDGTQASSVAQGSGRLILFNSSGEQRKNSTYRQGRKVSSRK